MPAMARIYVLKDTIIRNKKANNVLPQLLIKKKRYSLLEKALGSHEETAFQATLRDKKGREVGRIRYTPGRPQYELADCWFETESTVDLMLRTEEGLTPINLGDRTPSPQVITISSTAIMHARHENKDRPCIILNGGNLFGHEAHVRGPDGEVIVKVIGRALTPNEDGYRVWTEVFGEITPESLDAFL